MTATRTFRYLWRLNAVLILFSTGAFCAVGTAFMLSQVGCGMERRREIEAAPPVVADPGEKLYLGTMQTVEGTGVLRGELLAPASDVVLASGSGYGGYLSDTRNVLYVDVESTAGRWLLPDSKRVIAEEATVSSEGPMNSRRTIAALALVKDLGPDRQLTEGMLLIFDPAGRRITTIADGVRTLNHASLLENDRILVLYERGRRYVRALLDAGSFEVKSVQEIQVPELD